MSRLACLCFGTLLSVAPGSGLAQAYEHLVDPKAANRVEISFNFSNWPRQTLVASADGEISPDRPRLPTEYGSAMTWYRVAMVDGYRQPPLVASPLAHDEQLPEPLHWAWIADNSDLITRVGKGVFRMSFAGSRDNWFTDMDCKLQSWPGGDTEAPMNCNDGTRRMLRIPGGGIITVDDVSYTRVFESEDTTLPPEVPTEELMKKLEAAGAVAASPQTGSIASSPEAAAEPQAPQPGPAPATAQAGADASEGVPANVPIPKPRPDNGADNSTKTGLF